MINLNFLSQLTNQQKNLKKFWKAKSAESFNNNLPANSNDPATLIFKAAMTELIKTKRQSSAVQSARVERILR